MKSLFLVLLTTLSLFQPSFFPISEEAFQKCQVEWQPSWTEARLEAEASAKPLLLLFAGSDWCRPCMQWDREVFEQPDFTNWAAEKVIPYKADFPRKKKNQLSSDLTEQHAQLAQQYNAKGLFPFCVLIHPDGTLIASTGYLPGGVNAFTSWVQKNLP